MKDVEELANARDLQNTVLQAEMSGLKSRLAEMEHILSNLRIENEKLSDNLKALEEEVKEKNNSILGLDQNAKTINAKYEELNCDFESLVSLNDTVEKERSDLQMQLTKLSNKYQLNERSNSELTAKCDTLENEILQLNSTIVENENAFPQRLETSELVISLKQKNLELEDELGEKKQVTVFVLGLFLLQLMQFASSHLHLCSTFYHF